MKINKSILGLSILILCCGCNPNVERGFFELMRTSYPDIKIDSSFYYLKSFGLSDSSQKIGKNLYWKLHGDKNAEFFMSGFLRQVNDSIMIIPYDSDFSAKQVKEYKLFDFNAKVGSTLFGDSVVFQRSDKLNHDQIYIYKLYPYLFYPKKDTKDFRAGSFEVSVSKGKGIIDIKSFQQINAEVIDTTYHAVLYPRIVFTNKKQNLLDL